MKNLQQYIVLVSLFLLIAGRASANLLCSGASHMVEKVVLFTDRSIYIAGEKINFSASVINKENTDGFVLSTILYCELVSPDGTLVANNKYLISGETAGGCLVIPENQLTGIYYLRVYTKLMRNQGPACYAYRQIRIVNPRKDGLLSKGNDQDKPTLQAARDQAEHPSGILLLSVSENVSSPGDTIGISLQQSGSSVNLKNICLSVVPENSKSFESVLFSVPEKQNALSAYYPEIRGPSLTGKLTETNSLNPVADKRVNLSVLGKGRDFMSVRTDSAGLFYFTLPDYPGSKDMFLSPEKVPSTEVKMWIDNDFCTLPFRLPWPEFSLTEKERLTARMMAQNMQIEQHFKDEMPADTMDMQKPEIAFYGKPTAVIYLDKYIQLPTMEEYFNELPSQVKVRKRKEGSYFAVQQAEFLSMYDPLVMLDWVAIDEPAKVLAVSPQSISRIEIVNEDYVKGGQIYGGIISIISKKGNFAGIDLPSAGVFINYRFPARGPCREGFTPGFPAHPDTRNTVLWKTGLHLTGTTTQTHTFIAPRVPGKYVVVAEGITRQGEIVTTTREFEVRK